MSELTITTDTAELALYELNVLLEETEDPNAETHALYRATKELEERLEEFYHEEEARAEIAYEAELDRRRERFFDERGHF
ncbi:hypothetical protein HTZ84_09705 [Haloterrigena sp. SYSU A558-1]|uniref:Uncharacterized protein n=1 Tax=Haloterrigena gelatinilytica TaxID=2741724 RepID=A0ABX2L8I6_9EURY|nr:hypothetical protein [Haloterrigena gelatinilytica]NUC72580.1 hypothetical protein [Haloterrigena gelatinilytica]